MNGTQSFRRRACRALACFISCAVCLTLLLQAWPAPTRAEPVVSQPGEASDTIPGNRLYDPEFDIGDFATGMGYGKWYPNNSSLSRETSVSFAGGSSMKVSDRTVFWSRGEYRIWFGDLAYETTYYLQGAVSAAAQTTAELHVDVIAYGGPAGNEYPTASLTLDAAAVSPDTWKMLAGSFGVSATESATQGKVDVTVSWAGQSQVLAGVTGVDCIQIYVQEAYHENSLCPDLYLDSFLFKAGGAPHAQGENTEHTAGNRIRNSSFETEDFATDHQFGKWYPAPGSTAVLHQANNYSQSGSHSLRVSSRTAFWHRAQYRIPGSEIRSGAAYVLSGYVSAAADTRVELILDVFGYTDTAWPSQEGLVLATGTAGPQGWTLLSGSLKVVTSANPQNPDRLDVRIFYGDQMALIENVAGLDSLQFYIQQPADASSFPDLWLDSFRFIDAPPTGHAGGENTEEIAGNLIHNSSFEAEDFAADHTTGKWYKTPDSTAVLTRITDYSQSGTASLKVSGRTAFWHRAQYRVWCGDMAYDTPYALSGYVSAAADTPVELIAVVWGYGGPAENPYPSVSMTLATGTAGPNGWTQLDGEFQFSSTPAAEGKVDVTVSWGNQSGVLSGVTGADCIELYIQQPADATAFPDLYLDSFQMIRQEMPPPEPEQPTGHAGGENTEEIAGNLIHNSSFEAEDFAADHTTGKWYKTPDSTAVLTRITDYSQSGTASLKVSGRTAHWHRAQYRVEGSQVVFGHLYKLSGYVSAAEALSVELSVEIIGYGGPAENPYPSIYLSLASGRADASGWTRLSADFTIYQTASPQDPSKVDLTISYGDQIAVVAGVTGLSVVQITIQEPFNDSDSRPDLYLDSFLLQDITPPPSRPTGHTGAPDPSLNTSNLLHNGGFETDDLGSEMAFEQWYPDPVSVSLTRDTTYSHSGTSSLLVGRREEHWNRPAYRIAGEKLALAHTYELSGYASSLENTEVELILEIFGYAGPEDNRTYPSQSLTLSRSAVSPGTWTGLSGAFTVTQVPAEEEGLYDLWISWSGGADVVIEDVYGLSGILLMVQEPYSAATPRTDLYLDSFLLQDITPPPSRPAGHAGAPGTESDPDNLIENPGFEQADFVSGEYAFGKWYTMAGCPAILTQDTSYSHSGAASLLVSGRELFWHRAEYRVEGGQITLGDPYEISGYISSAENANVELLLQIYGYGGPADDPYPSVVITADRKTVSPGRWTKLSAVMTVTAARHAESGYYDYTVTVGNDVYTLSHVRGLSSVQIMPQEAYSSATPRPDLYLDTFLMKNTAPPAPAQPLPTGHTGAPDTEEFEGNLINNSGFETDLFADSLQVGLWFTNGSSYGVEQVPSYSHSGGHSARIYNRRSAGDTLLYRVEGNSLQLDTPYTLSGYAAAPAGTKAMLMLSVYGYAGEEDQRTYPQQTLVISQAAIQDWTLLEAGFTLHYADGRLSVESGGQTVDIGECIGLSLIEFYVATDETAENYTGDLYLDSFSLMAGAGSGTDIPAPPDEDSIPLLQENGEDTAGAAGGFSAFSPADAPGPDASGDTALYIALLVLGGVGILAGGALILIAVRRSRKRSVAN